MKKKCKRGVYDKIGVANLKTRQYSFLETHYIKSQPLSWEQYNKLCIVLLKRIESRKCEENPPASCTINIENNQNQVVLSVGSVVIRLQRDALFLFGIKDFSSTPSDSACDKELNDGITPDKVEE